ncbi:DUF421 domain-containing protein [Lutibacter sp. B2]|nr:DUF421 domain-containing protein [Lutibacter sp. B2]
MNVFGVIKEISIVGYIIRTFIVGIIVFATGRFIPKRALNQLTLYDFLLVWILGALTVAPLLDGKISFTYILVPLLTLFFWHFIFNFLSIKNRNFSFFFHGKPSILIDNGKIIRKNLKKHFISIDLLLAELRLKNIFDISQVKYTILEPNGHLSIIKKEPYRFVTPIDMKQIANPLDLPIILINDGKLIVENVVKAKIDNKWLMNNLAMYNIDHISNVYLATIDSSKRLYISKKESVN